ncbi:MAG: VWA domain-containing protein [Candidatus Kapabacteria bacterium]|nr:VWA domain-containing protein [Candidatus Kapabacteria bacterium]
MKIFLLYLIFAISAIEALGQSLSVFNIDTSSFPVIRAKFFAFDGSGNQIRNIPSSDFSVSENGQLRTVLSVFCSLPKPSSALSSVLVMDQSGSMGESKKLDAIHESAKSWISALPNRSECAITAFDTDNYIVQDFSTDKKLLIQKAQAIKANGGTDYNKALIDPMSSGILMAKTGKYKRVIIMMSDGLPNFEPRTAQIINEAKANSILIYFVSLGYPSPQCMKDITQQTGGQYFENISTAEEAKKTYMKIMQAATGGDPCDISWQSEVNCQSTLINADIKVMSLNISANASYQSPSSGVAKLEFSPSYLILKNIPPSTKKDTIVKVTARNADFNITNINSSNTIFSIDQSNFTLKKDQSINLTFSFNPIDSGYCYCKFTFDNDVCPSVIYASGGFPGKKPNTQTLHLLKPNGTEVFLIGSDTVVTWEGVVPEEKVRLEYSIDSGKTWVLITNSASDLKYKWHVPKSPSNVCLARVTADVGCGICDDVYIGKQVWSGCNLNVDHFRNGDSIPEVRIESQWANRTSPAWCYYNNDPAMGKIYGKLYNWYAVNDPRGLAPAGWHVASDAEWTALVNCLGADTSLVGGKLKEVGTVHWRSPNVASNEICFNLLPGGIRYGHGPFDNVNAVTYLWTASSYDSVWAWGNGIANNFALIRRGVLTKYGGSSVRCVKN